jgi:GT2 family glycosyltransferase
MESLAPEIHESSFVAGETDSRVAVVILTYNRINCVLHTIERLLELPERPQLVVVDNGSADGTSQALASRFPTVEIIQLKKNLGASGRNFGIQRVRTPFVALCDDDTWWAPGSLKRAADLLDAYPRLALVTGRVLVGPQQRLDPPCARMAASPLSSHPGLPGPAILGFLAGASVIRKSAFLEVGGFEPRFFIGGEESLVAVDLMAAGWGLAYVDQLVTYHHPSRYRDVRARRRLRIRNALWFAWLRRPTGSALRKTFEIFTSAVGDTVLTCGFADAVADLPWALRNRRVVPLHIEEALKCLEDQDMEGRAERFPRLAKHIERVLTSYVSKKGT